MRRIHRLGYLLLIVHLVATLAACTVISNRAEKAIEPTGRWVLLPFVNHTDTPQAALAAESIVFHLVRARGVPIERYPATMSQDTLLEPAARRIAEEAQQWARQQQARYALRGSVQEWRYKVGIDGEPAVGVALELVDIDKGTIVWSAAGGKSGWSREALSAVAQKLLANLLASLPVPARKPQDR